jgi:formylglycine-generating enzyme required for sulfatase activity
MVLLLATTVFLGSGCGGDDDGGPAPDTTPPAAVSNLSTTAVTDSSATLEWTAPGDNGTTGTASEYDIRYATELITDENWSTADSVDTPPAPQSAGSQEILTVDGLSSGTPYYFALKTVDDASNWSDLSNVPSDTTTGGSQPEEPLLVISPDSLDLGSEQSEATFTITNAGTGTLRWAITDDQPWMTASPDSGSTMTEADEITVMVDRDGLDPGDYTGTLTVTPDMGDPQEVDVTMNVPGFEEEMVYVAPGSFQMGSPVGELGRDSNETQHPVTLTQGFFLSTHEVTEELWDEVMGGGSTSQEPKVYVSWDAAIAFCNALSEQEGLTPAYEIHGSCGDVTWNRSASGYRLPTEAEWEHACRAGSETAFANGDITEIGCGYDPNLAAIGWYCGDDTGSHEEVGQKDPNAWGLYDMHGNVWECCWDGYRSDYENLTEEDPVYDVEPESFRVVRGGGWYNFAQHCRSAYRSSSYPSRGCYTIGFRIARSAF